MFLKTDMEEISFWRSW